mgnify:FL=1
MHNPIEIINNEENISSSKQVNQNKQLANHIVAIDLGSNSFHLIIAREQAGCLQTLYRQKSAIGLAAGLNSSNILSDEAINKAIHCLREFNLSLNHLSCNAIRIVATHALRKAKNIQTFIDKTKEVFPYPIEIISGKLEAELIYKGVAHTHSLKGKTLIIDIGGGSTEFVVGKGFNHIVADSLEMGCITFKQYFFANGAITQNNIEQAQRFALKQLFQLPEQFQQYKLNTVIGTSGSIKTISHIMFELWGDYTITKKRLNLLAKALINWKHCNHIQLRPLAPHRRPLLARAVTILLSCLKWLKISQINFSTGGVREGVLYSLTDTRTDIDTKERTVQNLVNLYHVDHAFSARILKHLTTFQHLLNDSPTRLSDNEFQLLIWAARLHEIGIAINSKKRQKHGAYIIEQSNMPGFTAEEQTCITYLVGNHRGKLKVPVDSDSVMISNERFLFITQLLRLAILLTQGRQKKRTLPYKIEYIDDTLILALPYREELMQKLEEEIVIQQGIGLRLLIKRI